MTIQNIADKNKLHEDLGKTELDNLEFQEVFSFVESVTGQNVDLDDLTSEDVEQWNQRFGLVLDKLFEEDN